MSQTFNFPTDNLIENAEKPEKAEPKPGHQEERELFEARTVLIGAPVNAKLALLVNAKLLALERAGSGPIYLYINSPGGEVHSGYSIFDTARFIAPSVITIVSGLAASMGSIIALCALPQHRFAFPNAKFLVHQPSISGGLGGSVSDIEIHAKDLIDTKNRIIDLYVEETGQTPEAIRKALDRDSWMSSEQAAKFGLITKVIRSREELKV